MYEFTSKNFDGNRNEYPRNGDEFAKETFTCKYALFDRSTSRRAELSRIFVWDDEPHFILVQIVRRRDLRQYVTSQCVTNSYLKSNIRGHVCRNTLTNNLISTCSCIRVIFTRLASRETCASDI